MAVPGHTFLPVTTIAVLGTGHMGTPIARRLLTAGHVVTVWNRTSTRTAAMREAGARVADSPADAVDGADLVITLLTDEAALDAVLFGPGGAARVLRPGSCLVQMSTVSPGAVRDLARRLPDGVDIVDAPVAGSVGAASAGTLTVLAGGEASVLERLNPVLTVLGRVRCCGGIGDGAAMKLVLNTALVTAMAALVDTLAVAHALGMDRDTALAALTAGPLGGAVERATAEGVSFAVALAGKDLGLALTELGDAPAPVACAAARVLAAAPDRTADIASLI